MWKLSSCDLCEIARNSVYQSGFSHALKVHAFSDLRRDADGWKGSDLVLPPSLGTVKYGGRNDLYTKNVHGLFHLAPV